MSAKSRGRKSRASWILGRPHPNEPWKRTAPAPVITRRLASLVSGPLDEGGNAFGMLLLGGHEATKSRLAQHSGKKGVRMFANERL